MPKNRLLCVLIDKPSRMLLSFVGLLLVCQLVNAESKTPTIIAHRGYPCRIPEETIEGYKHAIDLGVDYIEIDVVSTKDSVLLTRHDIMLDDSTDVGQIGDFVDKKDTKDVEGTSKTGYFTIDFTYEEVKKVTAKQRLSFRDHSLDDNGFKVPRAVDVLKLVKKARDENKNVGVYIETKLPRYHKKQNRELEPLIIEALKEADLMDPDAVYFQSFDQTSLKRLQELLKEEKMDRFPATLLLGCDDNLPSLEDLKSFAKIGSAIGPSKKSLVEIVDTPECNRTMGASCGETFPFQKCTGRLKNDAQTSELVQRAKQAGLEVHPYTFRNEDMYMALDFAGDPHDELSFYVDVLGVDGVFVDCADTALNWRDATRKGPARRKSSSRWTRASMVVIILLMMAVVVLVFLYGRVLIRNKKLGFHQCPGETLTA